MYKVPVPSNKFVYSLFNDAFSVAYTIWRRMKWYVIYELKGMWKDAVVVQLKVLSLHLHEGTEENHEK
jgi:hypothetical protein